MADNLTESFANDLLNWAFVSTQTPTRPSFPLMLRLMTVNGTATAAGTQVVGGGYTPQQIAFGAASAKAITNTGSMITFSNMPACTVVGAEIWDSAGTPRRLAFGAAQAPRAVNAGEVYAINVGDFDWSLS